MSKYASAPGLPTMDGLSSGGSKAAESRPELELMPARKSVKKEADSCPRIFGVAIGSKRGRQDEHVEDGRNVADVKPGAIGSGNGSDVGGSGSDGGGDGPPTMAFWLPSGKPETLQPIKYGT
ncbi:hypothetical protein HPP92_020704 [Vanilla planifolia]|uniref:Uncharacterized protein n=1 Tax=Vanilla planifolia TaxID=51239 RepID=A0A835Q461_VANPL|nr:hypothetical protein HPP92_020704 [Vanilla planifolia]